MRQSTKFISVLLLIPILAACAPPPAQESALPPAPSATPTPLPTQTPEPTATATPVPEPFRIAAGYLERWDGAAYQQMVAASSYLVDASQEWVTAFDSSGMPVAAYHAASGLVLQPGETGLISLDGVPHVWNPEKLTWDRGEIWRAYGGSLQQWDEERGRYVDVKTGLDKNESVEVDALLRDESSGLLVAIEQGKIVAMLDEASHAVVETPLGIAFRSDGWGRVYHQGVMENYLRIEGGIATAYDSVRREWLPVLAADGAPVQASGNIKKVDGTGFLVLTPDETSLAMLLDTKGNLIPAYNGEILIGYQVYRYDGTTLVDSGKVAIEWLIGLPGHEVLTSTGIGPELTVVIAEKALGIDVKMRWANEAVYRKHWLINALNRMKDDGYLDPNMNYSQFLEWLEAGNKITLKQLDAIDAATGRPPEGRFNNIEVEKIVVLMTRLNPEGTGEPVLPIEGGTRFSSGTSDQRCDDYIYDPYTNTLYLVKELDPGVPLSDITRKLASIIGGLTVRLRLPASMFDSDQTTTSRSGRRVYSSNLYSMENIGSLIYDIETILVENVK